MAITGFTSSNQTPSYFQSTPSTQLPYGNVPGFNLQNAGVGTAGYAGLQTGVWGNDSTILDAFGAPKQVNAADGSGILPPINIQSGSPSPSPQPNPAPTPDPVQIKKNNITQIATDKGTEVALDYASNYADQMSPDQYYAMIDQEAGNSNNFLNQQEANIKADQPGIEKGITDQQALLNNKALNTKEDAQSASRRLYSELQQGYKQRFGGASSAGEAAMSLTNNEQQRQMAQNNRTYQDTVTQIDTSALVAVKDAQSEFRNQLLAITQNRTAVESERLAARRQALSDLSQKVFAIQQQRDTFKQNLQLMQEQARLSNNQNISGMNTNPSTNLTFSGNQTTASGNQGLSNAVGSINNTSTGMAKNTDPLANGIYPIQTTIDGRTKYSDGSIR